MALDRGLFIIADEIYDQLVYEPNKPSSIIVWWKQYPDRIAVVNGLAKSFAMTGWRVGYTVTHPTSSRNSAKSPDRPPATSVPCPRRPP